MKKLLFALMMLAALVSCEVKHDHSKQMQQARVPVDSAQKDDITKPEESWSDEELIEIPKEERVAPPSADFDKKMEQMMSGKDVEF